jgi:hypothetical protein
VQFSDQERFDVYLAAWEDWMKQLEHVHRVFFDGEAIRPEQMKGLLNREARKKQVYDDARLALLGIDDAEGPLPTGDGNPFKHD